jgi:hypothetical protein
VPATPNIASRTVTGKYVSPDGTAAEGTLRFLPSVTVYDVTGHVVVQRSPISVDLDLDGSFSIELSVTDDPDAEPQGWTWHLTENLAVSREIDFLLPSSSPPTVDIATLLPGDETGPFYQYASVILVQNALASVAQSVADVEAIEDNLNDRMDDIDSNAAVVAAAVLIHPFLVMGA